MNRVRIYLTLSIGIIAAALVSSCSTTRRIPADEILYTGIKSFKVSAPDSVRIPSGMISTIKSQVNVAPNNYWKLVGWRYPFPLGLWVYNNWPNPPKGFRHWLYEKLVEEPVLVSDVRPEVRTHMIEQILDNNGYFRGTATYSLVQGKNPKKAKILYDITPGPAYPISGVQLMPDSTVLGALIDSLALSDSYLKSERPRYSTDSLSIARTRITNALRNRGYYFFRPEFIEYLADSIAKPGEIELKMMLASNVPKIALQPYTTGKVTVHVARNQGGGEPDTVEMARATLIQMMPSKLRRKIIDECVSFRPGRRFAVRSMDRTQSNFARLGIFNNIDINAVPDTSDMAARRLNVDIYATFDEPLETSLEVNASSKSNSYIGPGMTFGVTNKNMFGGGEQLSVKLTGTYEWQTGDRKSVV